MLARASGEPNASTGSPTATASELPNSTGVSPVRDTLSTAMSDSGSRPTTRALTLCPSSKVTVVLPAPSVSTWSLVITYPSSLATKPEPRLSPPLPTTRMVTTLGMTRFATPASESGGRWARAGASVPDAPRTVPEPAPPRTANA